MNICCRYDKVTVEPECVEMVRDQIHKSHRYRNDYVAMRREIRKERDRKLIAASPRVAELLQERERLEANKKALLLRMADYKKLARTRSLPETLRTELAEIKAQLKECRSELRAAKTDAAQSIADDMKEWVNDHVNENYRIHVTEGGMWYGTQGRMRKQLAKAKQFKAWDGSGMVAMEVKGRPAAFRLEALEESRRIVTKKDGRQVVLPSRVNQSKPLVRASFSESPKTKPFIRVTFRMHRPLPDGAAVKWVELRSERIGPKTEYALILTLVIPDSPPIESGVAGLAFCWNVRPDRSLHVATWIGCDGDSGEVVLLPPPARTTSQRHPSTRRKRPWWERMDRVEDQQGRRDHAYKEILSRVRAIRGQSPDWFCEATEYAHRWRSPKHLVRLLNRWRDERFEGDEDLLAACEEWRRQDTHRWSTQSHQRRATLRQRLETYRAVARQLSQRYGIVAIETVKLKRRTARRHGTELPNKVVQAAQKKQDRAAIGRLVTCLRNKCRIIEVTTDCVGSTTYDRARDVLASGLVAWKYGESLATQTA